MDENTIEVFAIEKEAKEKYGLIFWQIKQDDKTYVEISSTIRPGHEYYTIGDIFNVHGLTWKLVNIIEGINHYHPDFIKHQYRRNKIILQSV